MTSIPNAADVHDVTARNSPADVSPMPDLDGPLQNARLQYVAGLVSIARPHHYGKNILVGVGSLLAFCYGSQTIPPHLVLSFVTGIAATCLIASSNYVLNAIFDAGSDRFHELKCHRPMVRSLISRPIAFTEWFVLLVSGLVLASTLGTTFLIAAAWFHLMAIAYNVPPLRLKDFPYLDVISESANSPIRLVLGWSIVQPLDRPGVSMLLAFWMAGAFEMARKRLREYRFFRDKDVAAAYRKSFSFYNERRLQTSMMFYALAAMTFAACEVWVYTHHSR